MLRRLCVALVLCFVGAVRPAVAQVSQKVARTIMGEDFIGPEEVARHFGIRLTEDEHAHVRQVPYSETTLRQCRNSHVLFLGVPRDGKGRPLTVRRLREMFPVEGQPCFRSYPKPSKNNHAYSERETPELRWYLIARSLREESRSRPYWQQNLSLRENEYREKAAVYVYMMLSVYKARGERLFEKDLVFCSDAGSDGSPVIAGYFGPEGIYVSDWWHRPDEHFGAAPARKPDFPRAPRTVESN